MSSGFFEFYEANRESTKKDKFIGNTNISKAYRRFWHPIKNKVESQIAHSAWYAEEKRQYEQDKKVLDELYSTLTPAEIDFIKNEIKESEGGTHFELIDKKPWWKPEWQKGYGETLMNVWVDQSCGMAGDDYYGYVYVEIIPNKKYLKWYYSM